MQQKIMTINLCASLEGHPRKERMDKIKQFMQDNIIDICCVQECIKSCHFYDILKYLADKKYNYVGKNYIGMNFFYTWQVGILSRFPILEVDAYNIEVPQTDWIDSLPLIGRRRAVVAKINVDGKVLAVVNVHMSSSPKSEEYRLDQHLKLLSKLKEINADAIILAGDFNAQISNKCFDLYYKAGFNFQGYIEPDYILSNQGISLKYIVLNDGTVTDHAGGVLIDWSM